jgi:Family of unknown function (DUF6011)
MKMTLTMTAKSASTKQINWIRDMLAERPNWHEFLNGNVYETAFDILGNVGSDDPKFITMSEARALITELLAHKPTQLNASSGAPSPYSRLQVLLKTVQPGFYALPRADGVTFDFLHVVEVEKGNWKGCRFVNRLIGAPGSWQRQKPPITQQLPLARLIAADVVGAAKAYAQHYKRCCRCDSDLSHPRSQVALIGPTCATAWGWTW